MAVNALFLKLAPKRPILQKQMNTKYKRQKRAPVCNLGRASYASFSCRPGTKPLYHLRIPFRAHTYLNLMRMNPLLHFTFQDRMTRHVGHVRVQISLAAAAREKDSYTKALEPPQH